MEFDFLLKDEAERLLTTKFRVDAEPNIVRGFSCAKANSIFINLGAITWQVYALLGDEFLIDELTKTIIHEYIHMEIKTDKNSVGEEKVCKLLANQE